MVAQLADNRLPAEMFEVFPPDDFMA